jgi:hypothetical protein
MIVDRNRKDKADFGFFFINLVRMRIEAFESNALPADLAAVPAQKPRSK